MSTSRHAKQISPTPPPAWKLGEAKAKFSELIRLATSGQPQRVTVHGKDAVVIVAADAFQTLQTRKQAGNLHELLSQSPLSRIRFGGDGVRSPVREVEM